MLLKNDALRDDAAAGRRRLHIVTVCHAREATTASGVDNAASPDWQEHRLFWIISPSERGFSITIKQLEGTQKYINEQCR